MTHGGNIQTYLYIGAYLKRQVVTLGVAYLIVAGGPAYDWEEIWQRRDSEGHRAGAKLSFIGRQ